MNSRLISLYDIRMDKQTLERKVEELVSEFTKKTGVQVSDIIIESTTSMCETPDETFQEALFVSVDINLKL